MNKVLFLDIDGVLNTTGDQEPDYVDPAKVALIDEVCAATGAVVVVSSEWRQEYSFGHQGTTDALRAAGLKADIVGFTPIDRRFSEALSSARRNQIAKWLAANPVDAYAIIDDANVGGPCFVHTNERVGITRKHADTLIRILGETS